jgi:S1-C subfamily serine protease
LALSAISEIQSKIAEVAREHGPAVVGIGRGWRFGSGTVIGRNRVLAAAHHVHSEGVTVTFAEDRSASAELVGADRDLGLALLEVDTGEVEPLAWAPADAEAGIGTAVVALANPGGRGVRASLGFVAAAHRDFRGPRGRRVSGALEHTATLPRGSAGGPLLDAEGLLLGVNALRLEGGLILALGPGSGLRDAVEGLARGEETARPFLGVAVAPAHVSRRMRRAVGLPERDGLLVRGVEDSSPAARAGIERGDLIVAAAGEQVEGIDALHRALDAAAGNGGLTLTVVRGTEEREVNVELAGATA